MLTTQQLEHLRNQLLRLDAHHLVCEMDLDFNPLPGNYSNQDIMDDLCRGLDLLILHRKGIME